MKIRIDVEGGPDSISELDSLHEWLRHEESFRGQVQHIEAPSRPGEMGPLCEALTVAVGHGGAAAGLVLALTRSLSVWLEHRRADVKVTMTLKTKTGETRQVEIDGKQVRQEAFQREIERLIDKILGEE